MRRLCLLIAVLLLGVFITSAQDDADENTLTYGEIVTGEITASDNVRYTFEGSAGDLVTITMIATDGNLDPRLYLTTPDDIDALFPLADNDDSDDPEIGERNSRIADFELPEDGTYLILASKFRGTGTFTLTLETPDNPATMSIDDEPSETIQQWAVFATGTSQYGEDVWSFMQTTGAPDTEDCGDLSTAWASGERDSSSEILALEYEQAVIPTQVNIYQTFNPGSIIRVELVNTDPESETTIELPDSADAPGNTPCPGVFTLDIDLEDPQPVNGVIIYLDQSEIGNWNEIDAVELVGIVPGEPSPSALENTVLTEQFIYNDAFSMMLPSGWVTDNTSDTVIVASDQATLDLAISGDSASPADGQIAISILLPETLGSVGLPTDQGPVALLEAFNAAVEATSPVDDYNELLSPGAITIYDDASVPEGTISIAYEYLDGSVLAVVQIGGDFADFEPLVIDILDQAFYEP